MPWADTAGVGSRAKVGFRVLAAIAELVGSQETVDSWRTAGSVCLTFGGHREKECFRRIDLAEVQMVVEQKRVDFAEDQGRTLMYWCAEGLGLEGR